jgi:hypothetical protein
MIKTISSLRLLDDVKSVKNIKFKVSERICSCSKHFVENEIQNAKIFDINTKQEVNSFIDETIEQTWKTKK